MTSANGASPSAPICTSLTIQATRPPLVRQKTRKYRSGPAPPNLRRSLQLPQMQFFKGKSYRGFCPIGPWLTVPDADEFARLDNLELLLTVNGAVRQRDSTRNLVFKPAETISELSTFANIAPGDVLLTGTPSGCALRLPPAPVRRIVQLLPERRFWKLFLNAQRRRTEYLRPGDLVAARIFSADGTLDLGEQTTAVLAAA